MRGLTMHSIRDPVFPFVEHWMEEGKKKMRWNSFLPFLFTPLPVFDERVRKMVLVIIGGQLEPFEFGALLPQVFFLRTIPKNR